MQHTSLSPIRIPNPHHRRAKAWAALHGMSLREAVCLAIDTLLQPRQPQQVVELPAKLVVIEGGEEVGS